MDRIIELLKKTKPGIEIDEDTELIKEHVLDSLSMISLVTELCDEFDIEILVRDIIPENFATPKAIYEMVTRLKEENE